MKQDALRHPGEVLRDGAFARTGLSVTEFAEHLGVGRVGLSRVLNGRGGISADLAARLAAALGGRPEAWTHLQADYDLQQAVRKLGRELQKIKRLGSPEN
jgi:antitoxin HigA-1